MVLGGVVWKMVLWGGCLEDSTLGGCLEDVLHDLNTVENVAGVGLQLNRAKSEIICSDPETLGKFICASLDLKAVNSEVATLLRSPTGIKGGLHLKPTKL